MKPPLPQLFWEYEKAVMQIRKIEVTCIGILLYPPPPPQFMILGSCLFWGGGGETASSLHFQTDATCLPKKFGLISILKKSSS